MKKFFGRVGLLVVFMSIYFVSYASFTSFFKTSQPNQDHSVEQLATWYDSQYPAATPWETCVQETE